MKSYFSSFDADAEDRSAIHPMQSF